jgi:hypothetical protein
MLTSPNIKYILSLLNYFEKKSNPFNDLSEEIKNILLIIKNIGEKDEVLKRMV